MHNYLSHALTEIYRTVGEMRNPVGPALPSVTIPTINVINKSKLLSTNDFNAMFEACSAQMQQHVAPMWMRGPWTLVANRPETEGYPIIIMDDPDQAGALGYHTESIGGKVWGRVFVKPVLAAKGTMLRGPLSVSAVLSHEIIEAYIDPNVNLWATRSDGMQVAFEAGDPVENDAYDIATMSGRQVSVSNFVFPAWFDAFAASSSRFDYMGRVTKPFTMSPGGYMVVLNPRTGQVRNVFGASNTEEKHAARQTPFLAARSARKTKLGEATPVTDVEETAVAAAPVVIKPPTFFAPAVKTAAAPAAVAPTKAETSALVDTAAPAAKTEPAASDPDKSGK